MILLLTLATASAAPTCSATKALVAEEGGFTDGSAPTNEYSDGQDICWKLAPTCPEGGSVSLHFTRVDVERGYDWVQVFGASGALLGKSAGTSTTWTDSGFTVWFHSDESIAKTGFSASYSCETLSEEEPPPADEEPA